MREGREGGKNEITAWRALLSNSFYKACVKLSAVYQHHQDYDILPGLVLKPGISPKCMQ